MRTYIIVCAMLGTSVAALSQEAQITTKEQQLSLSAGYGTQGVYLKADLGPLSVSLIRNSNMKAYIAAGVDGTRFATTTFAFNGQSYPSDTRILFLGAGVSQDLTRNNITLAPSLGIRLARARFKDKALVDAIGEQGIDRTWNGRTVGPTVENAYGDALTIDLGVSVGYAITSRIDLIISASLSPISFDSRKTLFGRFWGEELYPNSYHIDYAVVRAEGGLRFHL